MVRYASQSLGTVTLSFGVALFPLHATSVEALLRQADKALYHAKETGRDRVSTAPQECVQT
jgi:diguanylate cyclase (GGDEF)-like protein